MRKKEIYERMLCNKHGCTQSETLVYVFLCLMVNRKHQCWPSQKRIMKACRMKSPKTVSKAIRNLESKGFIKVYKNYNGKHGTRKNNIYTITTTNGI